MIGKAERASLKPFVLPIYAKGLKFQVNMTNCTNLSSTFVCRTQDGCGLWTPPMFELPITPVKNLLVFMSAVDFKMTGDKSER